MPCRFILAVNTKDRLILSIEAVFTFMQRFRSTETGASDVIYNERFSTCGTKLCFSRELAQIALLPLGFSPRERDRSHC